MKMMIYRYMQIRDIVNNIYIKNNINCFPIRIKKIINSFNNIKMIKYSFLIKNNNLTLEEIKSILGSEDGCTSCDASIDRYIIYYNDIEMGKSRIKWTLAHELGHVLLKHHFNSDGSVNKFLPENEYIYKEYEANLFASWILAHPIILNNLDIIDASNLTTFCNLSNTAANIRYSRFCKYEKGLFLIESDYKILSYFKDYIEDKHEDYLLHQRFINSFRLAY